MIDKNIRIAATPDSSFYLSAEYYAQQQEKIFARSWQFIGDANLFAEVGYCYPVVFSEGCLDEPLIISRLHNGEAILMSNVCTHRGFIMITEKTPGSMIRCRYHGRCYHPDGRFLSMPEFETAENFPTRMDNLQQVALKQWFGFYFGALFPSISFEQLSADISNRLFWFPFEKLRYREDLSARYFIKTNWALYCDNYLEGFHIPFVHKSLNKLIDYGAYETILLDHAVLQIGVAKIEDPVFHLPENAPDHGKRIGAYYYWLFPNIMLNFYPWGLSMNIIQPKGKEATEVIFRVYISDPDLYNKGAGSDLHRVELEDEEVVEAVYKGLQSRLYFRGRYSPKMETGVHHFHQLIMQYLSTEGGNAQ